MRGYPILNDDLSGRLSELDRRIARLEQPHDINYAKRLGPKVFGLSQESSIYGYLYTYSADRYTERIYGPSIMWQFGGEEFDAVSPSACLLEWRVYYAQLEPNKTTKSKGAGLIGPGIVGSDYELIASGQIPTVYRDMTFLYGVAGNGWCYPPTVVSLNTGSNGLGIEGTTGDLLFEFHPLGPPPYSGSLARICIFDNAFIGPDYEFIQP